ncbi:MAG: hypothetical protein IJC87_03430 [Clostridia bacterium]|nr:hypothetical protein [Clostridia bacterium]
MADDLGFLKVAEWVLADKDIKAVVVSAGGKTKTCKKVTDLLLNGVERIRQGQSVKKSLTPFFDRVLFDAQKIGVENFITDELMKIEQEVEKDFSLDFVLSRGEFVYAKMFSKYSGMRFVDSKDLIGFYDDGRLNLGYSEFKINDEYQKRGAFLTGGFYGAYQNGKIKTFSRGGSDFSGSIIARGIRASKYLNFTDVDGVYSIPPNLAKSQILERVSFDQIRLLGEFGASVLHPASVLPLYDTGAEIEIKNTFNKNCKGTLVSQNFTGEPFAVAICKNCELLQIKKQNDARETYKKIVESNVEIICSAVSLDVVEICFKENVNENVEKNVLANYYKKEKVSVMFFLKSDIAKVNVERLKKLKIARMTVDFAYGTFVVIGEGETLKAVENLTDK